MKVPALCDITSNRELQPKLIPLVQVTQPGWKQALVTTHTFSLNRRSFVTAMLSLDGETDRYVKEGLIYVSLL